MADARDIIRKPTRLSAESDQRDAQRDESPWRADAYAVVIGINQYLDPKIPDLRFARADAEALHRVLTDPTIGRFKPDNVTLLLDAEATERNIRSALGTQLPRRAGGDSTVFIYFAGHGAPVIDARARSADGLEKYLIPHDAVADDLRASGISMDTVQQYFAWLDASQVVCFLDSCYSGTAGGRSFDHPAFQTRAMLSDEFLDSLASEGRFIVTACGANEVSLESVEWGHGIFTHHLLEGLAGAADADQNGKVTIDELYEYVYRNVERDARALGGSMKPVKKGSVRGTVYLTEYETAAIKRVRECVRVAAEAWERGESSVAAELWREVLSLQPGQEDATKGLTRLEAVERERVEALKRKERILLGYVNSGALPMREYNRALTLLELDAATLAEEDRQRRRFLDSLIAGDLTIGSYKRSIDLIDTHTGEHSSKAATAGPPPAPPRSAPPPLAPAGVAQSRHDVPSPNVASSAVAIPAERPDSSHQVVRSQEPVAIEPVAIEPVRSQVAAGRRRMYAVAGAFAATLIAVIIVWNPFEPHGEIRIDVIDSLSPPTVPAGTDTRRADSGMAALVVRDTAAVARTGAESQRPVMRGARPTPGGANAVAAQPPLRLVSMVGPSPATNVSVHPIVSLHFADLQPGDRLDLTTINAGAVRLTTGGKTLPWRAAGTLIDTLMILPLEELREFNTSYTVTVDTGVRTMSGRRLAAPATFTFTTSFWDAEYTYRLTTDGRGPNEVLTANPECGVATPGASAAQEWYFTPSDAAGYYLMRTVARGNALALEGAERPDRCFLHPTANLATGMLWQAVRTPRRDRFFLQNLNFKDARALSLAIIDGNVVPMMIETSPDLPQQYWTFTRSRRR